MNLKYDLKPGSFALAMIHDDGPSFLEGPKTYPTLAEAKYSAEQRLRSGSAALIVIVEIGHRYWIDPRPEIRSTDAAQEKGGG